MVKKKFAKKVVPVIVIIFLLGTAITPFIGATMSQKPSEESFNYNEAAALVNIETESKSGEAYRTFEEDTYTLSISATLDTLEEGQFYETWLVRQSPFSYIDLGPLSQQESEEWTLTYSMLNPEIDHEMFEMVLVTIESDTATTTPSDQHILAANFQ